MSDNEMTLDECLAKAAEMYDEFIQKLLDEFEVTFKDQGASEREIAAEISRYQSGLAAWREEHLDKQLRAWLQRSGEELH